MEPKSTTHTTPHKHQPIATSMSHHFVVSHCDLVDIKAFCAHTEGKAGAEGKKEPPAAAPKPGQPAPPAKLGAPSPKPGEPPAHGGPRLAKEDESPLPPGGRLAPPPHPPLISPPKPLLLQVVPTAPKEAKKSAETHGVQATPAFSSHSAGEDTVTLVATMDGECSQYPQWTIADLSNLNGKPQTHIGKKWTCPFLPPAPLTGVKQFLGTAGLEGVQPRKYKVTCKAKQHQPTAHHELHVWVYPPGKPSLEISSEAGPKPPWEEKLTTIKTAIEALFNHAAELVPVLSNTKVELFTGKVTIKNGWEEVEGNNLAHFTVDADAEIELIKISTEVPIPVLAFFQKAVKLGKAIDEGEKIERYFKEKIGLYVEAGLFLLLAISIGVKGSASWDKEENGHFTGHLGSLAVEEGAALKLEARLDVKYDKAGRTGELFLLSGEAISTMTLSTSPRLETGLQTGTHLWLDNTFSWRPLDLSITAKVHNPHADDAGSPTGTVKRLSAGKISEAVTAPKENNLIDVHWEGHMFKEIKDVALMSIDLLTGATQPHPTEHKGQPAEHKDQPLFIRPRPAPWPKVEAAPPVPSPPPK